MDARARNAQFTLTAEDFTACSQACAFLRLPRAMPDYFRAFLAGWFDDGRPALAAALRALPDDRLADLYERLRDLQAM